MFNGGKTHPLEGTQSSDRDVRQFTRNSEQAHAAGLSVKTSKHRVMLFAPEYVALCITQDGVALETFYSFKDVGSSVSSTGDGANEITRCIRRARAVSSRLQAYRVFFISRLGDLYYYYFDVRLDP